MVNVNFLKPIFSLPTGTPHNWPGIHIPVYTGITYKFNFSLTKPPLREKNYSFGFRREKNTGTRRKRQGKIHKGRK